MKPGTQTDSPRKSPAAHAMQGALICFLLVSTLALSGCNYPVVLEEPATPVPPTATVSPLIVTAPSNPQPSDTPFNPQPTPTRTPTATPTQIPSPTATSPFPELPDSARIQYQLEVDFDYGLQTLAVEQKVRYPNLTGKPLTELTLIVDANRYPGVFSLETLTLPSETPFKGYTLEGSTLVIGLDDPLQPGQEIELGLTFQLDLPLQASALGYTNRETLLIDWYPFFPPYLPGSGWVVNPPWPYGEFLAYDLADYKVGIQVSNAPETLVLAAGAPAAQTAHRYEYNLPAARSFAWSASPIYQVRTIEQDGVMLVAYSYPEHTAAGEAALATAAQALDLYSERFSGYPRPFFSLVEAEFADGLEFDGLIFVSRSYHADYSGTPQDFLILLVAHEVAHQWWFGLVGNDQAGEPWLDEALATYSELIFYEHYYPELAPWWWQFRVNYFRPEGRVNWGLYDTGRFTVYFHAVYLRGALFLRDLRELMGEAAFFEFLRSYNRDLAYRFASSDDFFQHLAAFTGEEIGPLLASYFEEKTSQGD